VAGQTSVPAWRSTQIAFGLNFIYFTEQRQFLCCVVGRMSFSAFPNVLKTGNIKAKVNISLPTL
jgi:hypothetical protein